MRRFLTILWGAQVFIEPKALMFLMGTEMDFVDERLRAEFVFTNPNSKGNSNGTCIPYCVCTISSHRAG